MRGPKKIFNNKIDKTNGNEQGTFIILYIRMRGKEEKISGISFLCVVCASSSIRAVLHDYVRHADDRSPTTSDRTPIREGKTLYITYTVFRVLNNYFSSRSDDDDDR